MDTRKELHSDLAVPPGEYLEEVVGEIGMTKDELARRMGRPATKMSSIFKGSKAITPTTAMQLEKVVGVILGIQVYIQKKVHLHLMILLKYMMIILMLRK